MKKSSRRSAKAKAPKRRRPAKVKAKAKKRRTKLKAKAPKRRKRRAVKAKAAPKRRKRRAAKGKSKAAPKRRRRRAVKAKAAPKRRRRRVAKKSMKKSASKSARAMGMTKGARKNPGGILGFMKQEVSDFMTLAPSIAVQLGTMAAIGFASAKASEQIKKMVVGEKIGEEKTKAEAGFAHKYAGVISSGAITVAAFAAMKMMKSEKSKAFTLPVLFGGMAATLVQVLAAVKVDPKKIEGQPAPATPLPKISLGQRLGLPIGEYTAISGYLDVHGRQIAINGMGEYVDQPLGSLDIHPDRYKEGTVISMGGYGMGEYVDQPLGELTLHQGRYQEGTVLGGVHSQMGDGRQGARALGARGDDRVEDFIDSGSLSGSVFD